VDATPDRPFAGIEAGSVIDDASRQIRAPWAASIARSLFACALAILQNSPMFTASDA